MNRKTPMLPEDDVRETPPDRFAEVSALVGGFTLDACATPANAKCRRFYALDGFHDLDCPPPNGGRWAGPPDANGLTGSWSGEKVWVNPPFSNIGAWVEKAWRSHDAELVVMLVPATRTEQPWWQKHIEPHRDGRGPASRTWRLRVVFLPGRWHFLKDGKPILDPKTGRRSSPKFGCALLTWSHSDA